MFYLLAQVVIVLPPFASNAQDPIEVNRPLTIPVEEYDDADAALKHSSLVLYNSLTRPPMNLGSDDKVPTTRSHFDENAADAWVSDGY
jgi:hypothetical protein